jgi:hypothetical protein
VDYCKELIGRQRRTGRDVIATFVHNPALPLSLQVTAVKDLAALGNIPGRRYAIQELAGAITEYQARFIASSLKMLVN